MAQKCISQPASLTCLCRPFRRHVLSEFVASSWQELLYIAKLGIAFDELQRPFDAADDVSLIRFGDLR